MHTPFTRDIPADRLYSSRQIEDALGRLTYVADRQLFAVVTADPGCGKSTLIRMFESRLPMEPSMESEKFILTDKPHSTIRKDGFPLDSISLEINTNKYYYDLPEDKLEQVAVEDGFLEFFKNIYCVCEKDSFIPGEI